MLKAPDSYWTRCLLKNVPEKGIQHSLSMIRMSNFLVLLRITIIRETFVTVTPDHEVPKFFIQTHKLPRDSVVSWTVYFCLTFHKLIFI